MFCTVLILDNLPSSNTSLPWGSLGDVEVCLTQHRHKQHEETGLKCTDIQHGGSSVALMTVRSIVGGRSTGDKQGIQADQLVDPCPCHTHLTEVVHGLGVWGDLPS